MVTTGTQTGRLIELYTTETAKIIWSDDDDTVAENWPACYLLNLGNLSLGLEEAEECRVTDKLQTISEISSTLQQNFPTPVFNARDEGVPIGIGYRRSGSKN